MPHLNMSEVGASLLVPQIPWANFHCQALLAVFLAILSAAIEVYRVAASRLPPRRSLWWLLFTKQRPVSSLLHMPRLSRYKCAYLLKGSPAPQHVPYVLTTMLSVALFRIPRLHHQPSFAILLEPQLFAPGEQTMGHVPAHGGKVVFSLSCQRVDSRAWLEKSELVARRRAGYVAVVRPRAIGPGRIEFGHEVRIVAVRREPVHGDVVVDAAHIDGLGVRRPAPTWACILA